MPDLLRCGRGAKVIVDTFPSSLESSSQWSAIQGDVRDTFAAKGRSCNSVLYHQQVFYADSNCRGLDAVGKRDYMSAKGVVNEELQVFQE